MEFDRLDDHGGAHNGTPDVDVPAEGGDEREGGSSPKDAPSQPAAPGPDDAAEALVSTDADDFDRAAAREMELLVHEWSGGGDWRENLAHGRAFVERFGDDATRALLDGLGLGDHAAIVRVAARAGRHIADLERRVAELTGEAPLRPGSDGKPAALSEARRRELEEEHRRLRAGRNYWTDAGARRRVREIMEALHGTAPIPVHGARGDGGGR